MNSFRQQFGLLRSILMYYGIPFRKRRLRRFYAQFIQANALCFDIGAHVGNRIGVWADLGAQVVALEPQPHCMRLLERWYGQHSNVTLIEQAVGAKSGTQSLFISQRTPTVSSLSRDWINTVQQSDSSFAQVRWEEAIPVTITTLDALPNMANLPFAKSTLKATNWKSCVVFPTPSARSLSSIFPRRWTMPSPAFRA